MAPTIHLSKINFDGPTERSGFFFALRLESSIEAMIMTYRGRIKNGQIELEKPTRLPEGAQVKVEVIEESEDEQRKRHRRQEFKPIEMPGGPLSDDIIRDRR
jgi:hypothetical protein